MNKPIPKPIVFLILFLVLVFGWFATRQHEVIPDDFHVYLQETHELVEQGEYAAALERHIWYHENVLKHEPNMSGVRLSFALCDWRRLADLYPPAMEALIETRDRQADKIRAGAGDWDAFSEVESINGKLDDQALTVELFKHLHESQPALAKDVWRLAKSDVIASGEYELARDYIGNPMHAQAALRRTYERNIAMYQEWEPGKDIEMFVQISESQFVEETLELMQVFAALGRDDLARSIGEKSLDTLNDPRIEFALERYKE